MTIFPQRSTLWTALLCAAASTAAASSSSASPQQTSVLNDIPFPASSSTEFKKTIWAEFDGDFRRDLVCLSDAGLNVFWGAGSFKSTELIAGTAGARDLVRLSGEGPDGSDAFLTTGPAGAQVWSYDLSTDSFSSVTLNLPSWIYAGKVAAGDLDNDGRANDIVGLSIFGDRISVVFDVTETPLPLAPIFSLDQEILDVKLGDLIDNAPFGKEVLMLREASLRVIDFSGATTDYALPPMSRGALQMARQGGGAQPLALVLSDPIGGASSTLQVVSAIRPYAPLTLNYDDWVGLTAGLLDIGSSPDVIITRGGSLDAMLYLGGSALDEMYSVGTLLEGPQGNQGPAPSGAPISVDFDGDGQGDVAYPVDYDGEHSMIVLERLVAPGQEGVEFFTNAASAVLSIDTTFDSTLLESADGTLFNVSLPVILPDEPNLDDPNDHFELEVIVWLLPYMATGINSIATRHESFSVDGEWGQTKMIDFTLDDPSFGLFPVFQSGNAHIPNYCLTGHTYFFEVRVVEIQGPNPGGQLLSASKSLFVFHQSLASVWSSSPFEFEGQTYTSFFEFYWGKASAGINVDGRVLNQWGVAVSVVEDQLLLDALESDDPEGPGYSDFSDFVRELDPGDEPGIGPIGTADGGRQKVVPGVSLPMNGEGTDTVDPNH